MGNSSPFKISVILLFVAAISVSKTVERESKDPIVKAFNELKPEEKTDFISYFLALALKDWTKSQPRPPKFAVQSHSLFIKSLNISSENIGKFDKMNIPKESMEKLLQWTKTEFNLTTKNILELLKSKKCSNSVCLPDIGELCCPW